MQICKTAPDEVVDLLIELREVLTANYPDHQFQIVTRGRILAANTQKCQHTPDREPEIEDRAQRAERVLESYCRLGGPRSYPDLIRDLLHLAAAGGHSENEILTAASAAYVGDVEGEIKKINDRELKQIRKEEAEREKARSRRSHLPPDVIEEVRRVTVETVRREIGPTKRGVSHGLKNHQADLNRKYPPRKIPQEQLDVLNAGCCPKCGGDKVRCMVVVREVSGGRIRCQQFTCGECGLIDVNWGVK